MTFRRSGATAQAPAARITQEIVARLEAGTRPWVKPWRGVPVLRPLCACGIPYKGMNVFWLWLVADMCGYPKGRGCSVVTTARLLSVSAGHC